MEFHCFQIFRFHTFWGQPYSFPAFERIHHRRRCRFHTTFSVCVCDVWWKKNRFSIATMSSIKMVNAHSHVEGKVIALVSCASWVHKIAGCVEWRHSSQASHRYFIMKCVQRKRRWNEKRKSLAHTRQVSTMNADTAFETIHEIAASSDYR